MSIAGLVKKFAVDALLELYNENFSEKELTVNVTKTEFEGDYTLVLFSLLRKIKRSPEAGGIEIGDLLLKNNPELFCAYNIIKGFLNLTITPGFCVDFLNNNFSNALYGHQSGGLKKVMVEYSSPNTNKPLHVGHLRNIFLGWSIAEIQNASGNNVVKTCIVNDRGIHICKSMIAWQMFANGATPESTSTKGDHFVGAYYVKYNNEYKRQVEELEGKGMSNKEAEIEAPILKAAKQMLLDWEAGKPEVIELWEKMNDWVYKGFDVSYNRIGADFEKIYYESDTYLLGKKMVDDGLKKKVFFKKEDGSAWIDLTEDGLDEKVVLRKDGTSVYITQDIGLAEQKYNEYKYEESIYVIGDEQNYHMKVLKLILQKFGFPFAEGVFHLSYGMVDLPSGRMKSREGTVVDADDLMDEMVAIAAKHTEELGKVKDFTESGLKELCNTIGLGALKFFLLRVEPKKRMVFNPEESIDFHGFTGPFVQYTYARIKSILRKQSENGSKGAIIRSTEPGVSSLFKLEKELILLLEQYPVIIKESCDEHNPSLIAIFVFNLAKGFNTFYTEHSVLNAESEEKKQLRLQLCEMTANVIYSALSLLGIKAPERM